MSVALLSASIKIMICSCLLTIGLTSKNGCSGLSYVWRYLTNQISRRFLYAPLTGSFSFWQNISYRLRCSIRSSRRSNVDITNLRTGKDELLGFSELLCLFEVQAEKSPLPTFSAESLPRLASSCFLHMHRGRSTLFS